jgi:hypothetical protein
VIVRAVTVSNAALEIPLVLLYVLVLWRATLRPRARSLIAAGGRLGPDLGLSGRGYYFTHVGATLGIHAASG